MTAVLFRMASALLDTWLALALVVALATVGGSLVLASACNTALEARP